MIVRLLLFFSLAVPSIYINPASAGSSNVGECPSLRFPKPEEQKGAVLELKDMLLKFSASKGVEPGTIVEFLGSPERELRSWNYYRASWSFSDDGSSESTYAKRDARITRISIVEYVWERSGESTCKVYVKLNFSEPSAAPLDPYSAEGWPGDCVADCDYMLERLLGKDQPD